MSDPYASNVSLLVPFEYSTTNPQDYSPNKKRLIPVGATTPDDQDSKFYGKSVSFDGRTGYIDIPPSQDFNFGTGDYTVEFWIKLTLHLDETTSTYPRIIRPMASVNAAGVFQILIKSPSSTQFSPNPRGSIEHFSATGSALISSTTVNVADGQWHHVAFSRQGTTSRCFLDGVLKMTAMDSESYNTMGTEGVRLAPVANCRLQDLRITKGVCRYTGNFTPPDRFLSNTNLSGTVLTTEGLPKSGMTVRCIDRNPKIQRMWTTKTDKFGHYSFLLPKGDYTILAQDDVGMLNDQVKRVRN